MSNPFLRLFGTAQDAVRSQDATAASFRTSQPIEITASLSTTPTDFEHKLGKAYSGFLVISNPAGVVVREDSNTDKTLFIKLYTASGSGSVIVRVF